jgi:anti-sigma regulatory factor (Ser/Thr protein kinase)
VALAEEGATDHSSFYWLGQKGVFPVYGWSIAPSLLEISSSISLLDWQGDGVCLIDIGLIAEEDLEVLPEWVSQLASHPYRHRIAWVGSMETMSIIPVLQASGIPRYLNAADVLAPILIEDWQQRWPVVGGLCDVETPFTLCISEGPTQAWVVDGSVAMEKAVQAVVDFGQHMGIHAVSELRTCLVEVLTNALYHAPVNATGQLKYEKHQLLQVLPPADHVAVTAHCWQGWVVITIADQWGRLTPEVLLKGLYHQTTDEGLLDEDGRGMLLMHLLPQGWANFRAPGQQLTTVFVHPTQAHPAPEVHPARSFWFVEGA